MSVGVLRSVFSCAASMSLPWFRDKDYEVHLNSGQYHSRFEITFSTNGESFEHEETHKRKLISAT
jgi:hypothetical protein